MITDLPNGCKIQVWKGLAKNPTKPEPVDSFGSEENDFEFMDYSVKKTVRPWNFWEALEPLSKQKAHSYMSQL